MKNFIIPTSQTEKLARNILKIAKNFEVIFPDLSRDGKRYFPDGEIYMRILKAKKLNGKRVIVLYSGTPRPNEGLTELELILQILRDNNIKPEVFFTYFPYGMQDKVFKKGEANVAENLVEKLINYYKVKKIYIIDPHFGGRKWVKKYPIISISAIPSLIKKAEEDFGENILFLSPDKGGQRRTKISGFRKKRYDSFSVKILSPKINLNGEVVAVTDDMIKTGGTLLKFAEFVEQSGAKKILALITHGVIPAGILKIKKKYSKLYLTNTIEQKEANVDITDLILKTLSES
ncbi:MAG: ribose-phosphate diphosphokinase [bacterium]|nr:ribose-phosphate diphosphokinase [bacterium]